MAGGNTGRAGPDTRSYACLQNHHSACGHLGLYSYRLIGAGTRVDVLPCRCECHARCLLARAGLPLVNQAGWQAMCSCPGKQDAQARLDEARQAAPDFAAATRQRREPRKDRAGDSAVKQAFDAARAAAPGKSREQIREILTAELRDRGVPPLSGRMLDLGAEAIERGGGKTSLWLLARLVLAMGQELSGASDNLFTPGEHDH